MPITESGACLTQAGLFRLLAWFSPAFPIGAFAYSNGLEQVIASGEVRDAATLLHWIGGLLLHGGIGNDAVLLAASYRGEDVADLAVALAPSAERRQETCEQGTAFAAAVAHGWPDDAPCPAPYPVVVGALAARHAIPLTDALTAYLQSVCANLVSVAVRAVPLGQRAGLAVLAQLETAIAAASSRAAISTLDDLGSATLAAEIAAMRHETLQPRLFLT